MEEAISSVRISIRDLNSKRRPFFSYQKLINLHKIELYKKYTLLFVSILLFLIGAALGAIIRKGGIGLPLVLSVLIFLTYHYIGLFSTNAAEDNSISPFIASWLSTVILTPFAIILTKRASSDKGFVSISNFYYPIVEKIKALPFFQKRIKSKFDSMIGFYIDIFNSFPSYFVKSLSNLEKKIFIKPKTQRSYYSIPNNGDYHKFLKKKGNIILFKDFFKIHKLL